jgi:hypothetical protein
MSDEKKPADPRLTVIAEIAELLYGESWMRPLGRDAKVDQSSIARFLSGTRQMSDGHFASLREAIDEKLETTKVNLQQAKALRKALK